MPFLRAPTAKRLWRYTQMWNSDDVPATADAVNQLEPGCYGFVPQKRKDWFPNELKAWPVRYELIVHNTADRIQNGTLKLRCIDGAYQCMEYIGEILHETEGITIRWRRVATCNPPEVHELPLYNGYTNLGCKYFRTQENVVSFAGEIERTSGFHQDETFAVLPEGFRPDHVIVVPALLYPSFTPASSIIISNGEICETITSSDKSLYMQATFVAG